MGVGTPRCKSSWNCTLADEMMGDFWAAVEGGRTQAIPNFSTQPSWLYDGQNNADLKALGDYYGRLLAWYTKGQVTDRTIPPPTLLSDRALVVLYMQSVLIM